MQPPLANNTLLQNRFRVSNTLGQGGCGRTYLAIDEQRFNEQCVVKEYFPSQGDASMGQKSRELFQREAATLYQIEHPQIPEFRALFAEADRFFFVQDFVAGQPYHTLLQERSALGKPFTEIEVRELLERILPVLAYIHDRNIIHRDISPDNIMLRDRDRLPVLIDFGVVKPIADRAEHEHTPLGTVVGKAGFSPIEQLKTGKVYPHSDLYALAVTAIVLLTGKSPADIFDEMTVNWMWRYRVPNVDRQFADILDRMLSYRPNERYQSADEVLAALDSLAPQLQLAACLTQSPIGSQATVGGRSIPATPARSAVIARSSGKSPQPPMQLRQPRSNPSWWGWGLGIGLVAIIGASALVGSRSTSSDKPVAISKPNPAPPTDRTPELLNLTVNTPLEVSGRVGAELVRRYAIAGSADRELSIRVTSGNVTVYILHPDGQTPPGNPTISSADNYFFPYAGKFLLDVKSTQETNFTLSLSIKPTTGGRRPPRGAGMPPARPPGSPPN